MKTSVEHAKPKRLRSESPAIAAAIERRTLKAPLTVKGIGQGRLVKIEVSQFSKLDVDPTYQRGETNMVGQIVRALQSGGAVLDPVTLCQRSGDKTGKLWIVDGYQRTCAFQQLGIPFQAMIHESESVDAERQFFISLNNRKAVSANVIIKAWDGISGELMRSANEDFQHPLYNRINFQQGNNDNRISAGSLVRGMTAVVGIDRSGSTHEHLSRLDTALHNRNARARVEFYLRLIGKACPKGFLPAIVLRGIGTVARERWSDEVDLPHTRVLVRLYEKNWKEEVLGEKYFAVLLDIIRKMWR
jgi:hypothetical protein